MVVGVFPALKLGVLFVKQISKPLAQLLVSQAKNHPVFRTYFIIPPAQLYHWAEVKAKMYLMNLGKPTKVAKLNEAMAIELGANLMGEVIIFSIAGTCLILEYNRQQAKEAKKEEARLAQLQKFTDDIEKLYKTTSEHEAEIQHLYSIIDSLTNKNNKKEKHTNSKMENRIQIIECSDGNNNVQRNTSVTTSSLRNDKSLIGRAIVYYEKDVKGEKLS